jgi:hypothetical protein
VHTHIHTKCVVVQVSRPVYLYNYAPVVNISVPNPTKASTLWMVHGTQGNYINIYKSLNSPPANSINILHADCPVCHHPS